MTADKLCVGPKQNPAPRTRQAHPANAEPIHGEQKLRLFGIGDGQAERSTDHRE
jgi:hypothetical protein